MTKRTNKKIPKRVAKKAVKCLDIMAIDFSRHKSMVMLMCKDVVIKENFTLLEKEFSYRLSEIKERLEALENGKK